MHANLGVNWASQDIAGQECAGLSDTSIMLMVNASYSYHFLWRCTLSERPLLLLVLLLVKQFTAHNFPQIMLDRAEINNQMHNTVTNS